MRGGIRVIGYHGTSGKFAKSILKNGLRPSGNDYDWLGKGGYFFEENRERAIYWAKKEHPADPAIVGAVINLAGMLDLTNHTAITELGRTVPSFIKFLQKQGKPIPCNKEDGRRYFDRALIDTFCSISATADTSFPVVRGLFEEGYKIHKNSNIRRLTHIQLAVRDQKAILGMWSEKL